LEEVTMILRSHDLGLNTHIQPKRIYPISRMVTRLMRMPVQPNKAIVGRNAFAHSSGIHQDGVLKNRENYEIIDPLDVGVPTNSIVLTARSGKAALRHRFDKLGLTFSLEEMMPVYQKFLQLADQRKHISDQDLLELVGKAEGQRVLRIESLDVTCGSDEVARASVQINRNGKQLFNEATGNGPVDATMRAIDAIMQVPVKLEEYLVQAITGGSNDVAQVHVQISHGEHVHYGFGSHTDTVFATAQAYLDALSKVG
jgi:2-isopropylmalate synthase